MCTLLLSFIYMYMCAHMYTMLCACVCACVCVCVRACVRACVPACLCACVPVCVRACVRVHMCTMSLSHTCICRGCVCRGLLPPLHPPPTLPQTPPTPEFELHSISPSPQTTSNPANPVTPDPAPSTEELPAQILPTSD